jgi:CheY-like chemotaxis protein
VGATTAVIFGLFGYFLGRKADALAQLSETDSLTGLLNARGFWARLGDERTRKWQHVYGAPARTPPGGGTRARISRGSRHGREGRRAVQRLLLVEDEPGLVLTLTDRLTAEGYTVTSIGDGNAAVDKALRETYDIVVLDVMLPGRDGLEVCRAVRQGGMRAPILMLTARGQLVDRVVGLKLGADDYLVTPFEMA